MSRKSRPIVVKQNVNGEWFKVNYFNTTEEAEKWCITKTKNSNKVYRIEKNK